MHSALNLTRVGKNRDENISDLCRRSTAHREGWRISSVKGFIIGYLFVVHIFVVYISRRDEGC
jgi:hypothetical protein